jgi:hypothetical protein
VFKWLDKKSAEAEMRRHKVTYSIVEMDLAELDWPKSLAEQKRLEVPKGGYDPLVATSIGIDMLERYEAERCIVQVPTMKGARPWLHDGRHRVAGFREAFPDAKRIQVYAVCITDPETLDMFPRLINSHESSLGFSHKERVDQARHGMIKWGWAVKEAAGKFGLKPNAIYADEQVDTVKRGVADIPGAADLNKSILRMLHPLFLGDATVGRAVVRTLLDYKVGHVESLSLIADVKRAGTTSEARKDELRRWRDNLEARLYPPAAAKGAKAKAGGNGAVTGGRIAGIATHVWATLIRNLTGLDKVLDQHRTAGALQISDPVRAKQVEKLANRIVRRLSELSLKEVMS